MNSSETPEGWALPNTVKQYADGTCAIMCGRCSECGTVTFPKPMICSSCLSTDVKEHEVSEGGKLYTYSVLHTKRPGWPTPYGVAYVDFPEGVRIFGPLEIPADGNPVPLDSKVQVGAALLRTDPSGQPIMSHRFEVVSTPTGEQS